MSNRGDQNGRQPPLPAQPRPPPESRTETENTTSNDQQKQICRNYVWGTCTKNIKCKFRHELDFEEMKKILKFCHDYQNRTLCTREDCTYLHTTREEEKLFLATGQIPRVLAERHAAMSASASNGETIPQIAMFIRESFVPAPSVGSGSSALTVAPPPPPTPRPVPPAPPTVPALPMLPTMPVPQAPPPPPPPPPPPTLSTTVPLTTAPVFTAPPPPPPENTPMVFPMNQPPPPLQVMFDASRPPPPIPTQIKANNSAVKHKSTNVSEAGPSKIRKPEDTNVADTHCENCAQREIRINLFRQELEKLHCEEEYQTLLYKKNLEEFETGKELLRTLVSAELFGILEEHIEGVPQIQLHDILSQLNQTSFSTGMSTVPKQFLLQLMDCVFGNSRNLIDSPQSTSSMLDETLLQSLSTLPRRTNAVINSDVIQAFVDILQNSKMGTEKAHSSDLSNESNRIGSTNGNTVGVNGFNGCSTSQKTDGSPSLSIAGASNYSSPNAPSRPFPSVSAVVTSTMATETTAPPPPYPSYQPSIPPPPPTGPYFNHMFPAPPANNNQNIYTTTRASAPVTQPTPSRSSTSAAIPFHTDGSNPNQYVMGRFPPPPYYTPYQ